VAGLVIDASVAVKWFLTEDRSHEARDLATEGGLIAPTTILLEVYNALSIAVRRERAIPQTLKVAQETLLTAGWELVDITPYFSRAATLSRHLGHAIFDCAYLALAEDRGVPLVTADDRLFAAGRRARIKVQML
jgi:predicted nucleic acid-binding protein